MGSFGEFTRQVLAWKVQLLVQVGPPFGTVCDIINDAVTGDQLSCAALSCAAAEFHFCDDAVRDVHAGDYTGLPADKENGSPVSGGKRPKHEGH